MRTAPRPVRPIHQARQPAAAIPGHPRVHRLARHADLSGHLRHARAVQHRHHRPIPLLDNRQHNQCQSRPPVAANSANGASRSRPLSSINRDTPVKHLPRQDSRRPLVTARLCEHFLDVVQGRRLRRRRTRLRAAASGRPRRATSAWRAGPWSSVRLAEPATSPSRVALPARARQAHRFAARCARPCRTPLDRHRPRLRWRAGYVRAAPESRGHARACLRPRANRHTTPRPRSPLARASRLRLGAPAADAAVE